MVQDVQENPARLGQRDEDVALYRPVSRMAVVGLLSGLAASLAMANPVLWGLPPLAAVLSLWGLRNIRASNGALSGKAVAVTGLMLALFFSATAFSNFTARRVIARRQAEQIADRWIQMVEHGSMQAAHQWTIPYVMREAPTLPLAAIYAAEEGKQQLADFLGKEPGKSLSQMQAGDRIEKLGLAGMAITRSSRSVGFRYQLIRADQPPMDFGLSVRRFTDPEAFFLYWTVTPSVAEEETDTAPPAGQ